jgi:hypothetical protein
MLALSLALALQGNTPAPPPPWYGGRLLTTQDVHLGLRPAAYVDAYEIAIGVTLQLSTRLF